MTESIARQSVIIKCNAGKSVLLGNYEFYYAAGLMNRLFGIAAQDTMNPEELLSYLLEQMEQITPKDEKEAYLIGMVKNYEPLPEYDEQMKDLLHWGEQEQDLWQVQTSRPD